MASSVLLVDDNSALLSALSKDLCWRVPSLHVDTEPSSSKALDLLRHQPYHALITDLQMPQPDGIALLAAAKAMREQLPVIMITVFPDVDMAQRVLNDGAFDFLAKHLLEELAETVKAALWWHDMTQYQAHVREALRKLTARQKQLEGAYLARDRSRVDAIRDRETRALLTSSQRQIAQSFKQGSGTRDRLKTMIVRYEKLLARQAALTIDLREAACRTALSRFSSR